MAKRRTIGDNPLDSITPPSERTPARATPPARLPVAVSGDPEPAARETQPKPAAAPGWLPAALRPRQIRILRGDAQPVLTMLSATGADAPHGFRLATGEFINLKRDVARLDIETETAERRTGALLLWATAGAFLVGPLGALAGSLYGGRERRSTEFAIHLQDGRSLVATAHPSTVADMQAEIG